MSDAIPGEPAAGWPRAAPAEFAGIARMMARHSPARPSWTCNADGNLWPCPAARVHLRSQYAGDQVGLSMYMSGQLTSAAVDLAGAGPLPPDLFHRFLGWTCHTV
jgi:hypothetical protein